MAVFFVFILGMDSGDSDSHTAAAKVFKQRSGKRSVLCDVWYYSSADLGGLTGVDRVLAVFVFYGLCDSDRMDRRASDREGF